MKKVDENQELIDMLKEQIKELKPGSEEQARAVESLKKLEEAKREGKKSFRDWLNTGVSIVGTVGTLGLSLLMFRTPYKQAERNVYVTDRNGQDNIREAKNGVKDVLKKLSK